MIVEETAEAVSIEGAGYSLRISRQQPTAGLALNGRHIATLHIASGVDAVDGADEQTWLEPPNVHREPDALLVSWQGSSTQGVTGWAGKQIELRAWDDGFSYGYTIEGNGAIDRAHLLRTRSTASPARSVRMFNPEPNSGCVQYTGGRCSPGKRCFMCFPEQAIGDSRYSGPDDFMTISIGSDKLYHDGNWFFTPAPF